MSAVFAGGVPDDEVVLFFSPAGLVVVAPLPDGHRVADAYRAGRVVLAGDAAHVHSPAGGQGMNTGIQDATALGEALLAALKGDQAALDVYATTRRPVAERVISLAGRLTRLATVNRRLRPIRNLAPRILARNSGFRNGLAMRLSGLVYR